MKRLIPLSVALLLFNILASAAIPTTTIWDVRSTATAANANGIGFNYANAFAITDLTTTASTGNTATPVIKSASYNFDANDDEAWVIVTAGTNWYANQMCRINSVASNEATLAAAAGECVVLSNNRWVPNTTVGVASVATPTGGTLGVDFTQQDAAEHTDTDGASVTTSTTFTSTGSFRAVFRGNLIHITGTGTGAQCVVGWYHIESVTDADNVVLDRAPSAGTGCVAAPYGVGGAGVQIIDALFELATSSSTAANRFFVKGGSAITYTVSGTVTIGAAGNSVQPIVVESWASLRGDRPTGATRPTFDAAAATFTFGANWDIYNLQVTGTAASVLTLGTANKIIDSKITNTSTGAGVTRAALTMSADSLALRNETVAYRGQGINTQNVGGIRIIQNYAHDSDIGIQLAGNGASVPASVVGNVCESNVAACLKLSTVPTSGTLIMGNTLFGGATTKIGTCFLLTTGGAADLVFINNIISGCVTGINDPDAQTINYSNWNAFYNNTDNFASGDTAKWQLGPNDQTALDPQFASAAQYVNLGTVTTTTNVLTDSGATFTDVTNTVDQHQGSDHFAH